MSHLPVRMKDRWASRSEPKPGQGVIYWHMLMHAYPQVLDAAVEAQKVLSKFPGFHMTPLDHLHITTLVVGSTDEVTYDQMSTMLSIAQHEIANLAVIPVTLNKVLYHPEAVMIAVNPRDALLPILGIVQSATCEATGRHGMLNGSLPSWTPHITISYSTVEQSAAPIISALGETISERTVFIDSITLVIQWGAERLWNWESIGTAQFQRH